MGEVGENPLNVHAMTDAIGSILNWGLLAKFQLHNQVVTVFLIWILSASKFRVITRKVTSIKAN